MEDLKTAQAEMNPIVNERRVLTALTRKMPPATDRTYKLGQNVLAYSELKKEWPEHSIVVESIERMIDVFILSENMRKNAMPSKLNQFTSPTENIYR